MAFLSVTRLASKRLLGPQVSLLKAYNIPSKCAATAAVQDSLARPGESHDDRNARLNRPMSPHLTIYKFEMTSVLSITHRLTGIALASYTVGFAALAFCTKDFNNVINAIEAWHPGPVTIATAKFIVAFPMMYHTCNGLRHLLWDTGRQLNKKAVVTTGSAMLAATVLTTLVVMLFIHSKVIRPYFGWLNVVFNQVDHLRMRDVGPDRVCTEWILRNGGAVKWVGVDTVAANYNSLPSEDTKFFVEKIDATGSSISHYGFLHLKFCKHINEIKLNDCMYIENEALQQLVFVKDTLQHLHVSYCQNITGEGVLYLEELSNLKTLELFHLQAVRRKPEILQRLKSVLTKCQIKSDFEEAK